MPVESRVVVRRLRRIGFSNTAYLEAVAVLKDERGNLVNVVPLGFRLRGEHIVVRIFRGSRTYDIFVSGIAREGLICVTQDAKLFYYSIFDKDRAVEVLSKGRACAALVNFEVETVDVGSRGYALATLRPTGVKILRRVPQGFVRASALAIEALVWLTKIPHVSRRLKLYYAEYVRMCLDGMRRSAKSAAYKSMAKSIEEKLRNLVNEAEGA